MNREYTLMSVLITGGAGFIGSHVAEQLVNLGAEVTVVDDLSSGSLDNLRSIKDKIRFIHGNISDYNLCLQVIEGIDVIFHLAALISVQESLQDPSKCYAINAQGTLNLLRAAAQNKVRRFIFSSSSAVYGDYSGICSESIPPKPLSPYGTSKLIGELLCKQWSQEYAFNAIILRYFNVYGPRQNPNGPYAAVLSKFKHCMSTNQPIIIFGDGYQTRDFIAVEDVVKANIIAGLMPLENNWELFNVASGKSISLRQLIDTLRKEYPSYCQEISFQPARSGDIRYSQADCSKLFKIQELFGNTSM